MVWFVLVSTWVRDTGNGPRGWLWGHFGWVLLDVSSNTLHELFMLHVWRIVDITGGKRVC